MRVRHLVVLFVLGSAAVVAWAQQRKPDVIVGVNWQGVASASAPDGTMAWFLDAAQNRVMTCYSSASAPKPVCHAADLPEGASR